MYRAPVEEIAFTLKHVAGLKAGARRRRARRSLRGSGRRHPVRGGALRHRGNRAAGQDRRRARRGAEGRGRDHAGRLEGTLPALDRGRLERAVGAGRIWRPGAADDARRRRARNVEFRLDGLRHRPDADHGRGRGDREARFRGVEAQISRKARVRRMDGHDEPDRAAGRLRSRRAADARRAGRRRHLPHLRPEDIHHLWRARFHRQHRASGAGAAAGRAGRHARHVAVPGAEIPARTRTGRPARATMCSAPASSTSSASTARRPAP